MSIEIIVKGSFVDVLVSNELVIEDLPVLLNALEAARRRGPFVVLTDTSRMTSASRPVLSAFADALKKLPSMKKIWLADAVVVSSTATRFILTTLILIAPLPTNVKVFETREEAETWCHNVLRTEAAVATPSRPQSR